MNSSPHYKKPLVSIGLMVYNDEQYVEEALKSLLRQTYKNISIVVHDDASSDNTSEICKEFIEKDNRVRYARNEKNIGEVDNFNKAFTFTEGKYFMWAAGHDAWDKTFIEKAVSVMEKNPLVVACFPIRVHIGSDGGTIKVDDIILDTRHNGRLLRFVKSIWTLYDIIFALMRTESLRKTRLYQHVQGLDHVVRVELSLLGQFAQIKEPLFFLRHQRNENPRDALVRRIHHWSKFKRLNWLYIYLPHVSTVYEYARGACRLLPRRRDRILYATVAVFVGGLRYSKVIVADIVRLLSGPFRRKQY